MPKLKNFAIFLELYYVFYMLRIFDFLYTLNFIKDNVHDQRLTNRSCFATTIKQEDAIWIFKVFEGLPIFMRVCREGMALKTA